MSTMKEKHQGSVTIPIPNLLRYPKQISYKVSDQIPGDVQKLRLHSQRQLNIVNTYLDRLERKAIPTDPGNNNGLQAICMQLHIPKKFVVNKLRHQLACYLAEEVDFFFPRLERYLNRMHLTFSAYVKAVYDGVIWCDEYMIGAIGKMFNVRTTLVSPYFSDIWHVFHDGSKDPDIVLIVNGVDFGVAIDNITHITSTKGIEQSWDCVGKDQPLDSVTEYAGFTEGTKIALDIRTINENRQILLKTQNMLKEVNQLCVDVKEICTVRDTTIEHLKDIKIDIGDFQRLTSSFTQDNPSNVQTRPLMPVAERRVQIFPSGMRGIPRIRVKDARGTALGQQLVQEVLDTMDRDNRSAYPEIAEVHRIHTHERNIGHSRKTVSATAPNPDTQELEQISDTHEHNIGHSQKTVSATAPNPDTQELEQISDEFIPTPKKVSEPKVVQYVASTPKQQQVQSSNKDELEEGEIFDTSVESIGTKFLRGCSEAIDLEDIFINEEDAAEMRDMVKTPHELFRSVHVHDGIHDKADDILIQPAPQIIAQNVHKPRKRRGEKLDEIIRKKILKAKEQEVVIDTENAEVPHDADLLCDVEIESEMEINVLQEENTVDLDESKELTEPQGNNTISTQKSDTDECKRHNRVKSIPKKHVREIITDHTYANPCVPGKAVRVTQQRPAFDMTSGASQTRCGVPNEAFAMTNNTDMQPHVHRQLDMISENVIALNRSAEPEIFTSYPTLNRSYDNEVIIIGQDMPVAQLSVSNVHAEPKKTKTKEYVSTLPPIKHKRQRQKTDCEAVKYSLEHRTKHSQTVYEGDICPGSSKTHKFVSKESEVIDTKPQVSPSENLIVKKKLLAEKVQTVREVITQFNQKAEQSKLVSSKKVVPNINSQTVYAEVHAERQHDASIQVHDATGMICDDADTCHEAEHRIKVSTVKDLVQGHKDEELSIYVPHIQKNTAEAMIYKERKRMSKDIVTVSKTINKSSIGMPVAEDDQLPGFHYCDKCPKKFKDLNYFRRHMNRLCPALDTPEMIKCKHCNKTFWHERNYKEHLFKHDGIKRFNCTVCGEHFEREGKLQNHKKLYCSKSK